MGAYGDFVNLKDLPAQSSKMLISVGFAGLCHHARALDKAAAVDAGGAHPLEEIAMSAGHLLLLKLWQREEDRLGRRACVLEVRMDVACRDTFYLCAAFLALHSLALAVLFASSVGSAGSSIAAAAAGGGPESAACRRWWAPSSLSLAASLTLAAAVRNKVGFAFWAGLSHVGPSSRAGSRA
ncbi:uncharacterized protein LOC120647915 [Panicum virgatum]|uniref:uncharacterized protein LOC120647915 n=1 Tax=Panicum virgatum TaxID=38727 RepID=UPI0019D56CBE|nr:uncharacterized protein LOC120647915 [Panicum virgatum]